MFAKEKSFRGPGTGRGEHAHWKGFLSSSEGLARGPLVKGNLSPRSPGVQPSPSWVQATTLLQPEISLEI